MLVDFLFIPDAWLINHVPIKFISIREFDWTAISVALVSFFLVDFLWNEKKENSVYVFDNESIITKGNEVVL